MHPTRRQAAMITVVVERALPIGPDVMIDRIWERTEWHAPQPSVRGMAIEYDDGQHQSVQVCLASRSGYHAVSIMRFRETLRSISFFYSRPPLGFVTQTGLWRADAAAAGCCLRLLRRLQLEHGRGESETAFLARESAYGALLTEHLGSTIDALAVG